MNCPYCGKKLVPGFIYVSSYGINYSFKWLPQSKKPTVAALALEGEEIGEGGPFSEQPKIKCCKCYSCKKIIIDINE